MIILFDVAAGPVSSSAGVNLVVLLAVIIVIEALVLRLMKWRNVVGSLVDSTLMNLASALVGLLLINTGLGWWTLIVAFVLSIVMEAGVLLLLRRHPSQRTWLASTIANVASYALLFVLILSLGI